MDKSFTEQEVQKVADFVNFVFKKAKFDLDSREVMSLNNMFAEMHKHIKKLDTFVFEVKDIKKKPEGDKK